MKLDQLPHLAILLERELDHRCDRAPAGVESRIKAIEERLSLLENEIRSESTSLPAMLTLYVGLLPLFLVGTMRAELRMERSWMALLVPVGMAWLLHFVSVAMRAHFLYIAEDGKEGGESEFSCLV